MELSLVNRLISDEVNIFRILKIEKDRCFIIDCLKRSMPVWADNNCLLSFKPIDEDILLAKTNVKLVEFDELSKKQLKLMHEKYASISYLLVKIYDDVEKRAAIHNAAIAYKVSEQTIRHRLCDYLVFQNIVILAPIEKKKRELTQDEINFRWALNKYFYSSKQLSLRQAYNYLVREKYINLDGKILQNCPKFHQFKYFYYKNRTNSNFIISRLGKGEYNKNYRPLLGDGVRSYFPSIGYGMLDSTTCDIYLVNDNGELIGRPILTACIDAYSSMCLGYSIGWEGGINSLKKLMKNVVTNKVQWCKKFGIEINESDWDCRSVPHKLVTDMGSEYIGDSFSQLVDLGVEFINLEPYRPELKSLVERFFGLIQGSFKKELINKGIVLKDFGDRGAIDYRKNACLTLEQFEKILLLCIIHYNCKRIISLPYGIDGIKNNASSLWNYCLSLHKDMLIDVDEKTIDLTLMPRCVGRFRRDGLIVNRLRYKAYGFINDYLTDGVVSVVYDPKNVGHVWLIRDGKYYEFSLIEKYFDGMNLEEVNLLKNKKIDEKELVEELEARIRLSKNIEELSEVVRVNKRTKIKDVRKNRKKEILK